MIATRDWDFWCKTQIKRCGVVGAFIRARREFHRLTQSKLAKALGIYQGTLSMIESGKYIPTKKMRERLAELFHCSESLFEDM